VGIFDCEKPATNYGLLHKLVPIKRYGWISYSDISLSLFFSFFKLFIICFYLFFDELRDIHDVYALIAHLDSTLTLNTKELSRLNHDLLSFESSRKDLMQKLEIALSQKCNHGDIKPGDQNKLSNDVLIKYLEHIYFN